MFHPFLLLEEHQHWGPEECLASKRCLAGPTPGNLGRASGQVGCEGGRVWVDDGRWVSRHQRLWRVCGSCAKVSLPIFFHTSEKVYSGHWLIPRWIFSFRFKDRHQFQKKLNSRGFQSFPVLVRPNGCGANCMRPEYLWCLIRHSCGENIKPFCQAPHREFGECWKDWWFKV